MPTLTKNLELYYHHRPVANLTALGTTNALGIVNGLIIEVADSGLFEFQIPALAIADGIDIVAGYPGTYISGWNAATNTPALSNATIEAAGHWYDVTAAGTVNFGAGNIVFAIGDRVYSTGVIYQKGGVWIRQSLPFLKTVPVLIAVSTGLTITSMIVGVPYTYQCTAAAIVTLTIIGGTLRNPPVLNGSPTTLGFNPGDVFTLTLQSDTTILIN
jgi:hypothetical protein